VYYGDTERERERIYLPNQLKIAQHNNNNTMAGCQRSNICLSSWPPIATEHQLLKISKKRKEKKHKQNTCITEHKQSACAIKYLMIT